MTYSVPSFACLLVAVLATRVSCTVEINGWYNCSLFTGFSQVTSAIHESAAANGVTETDILELVQRSVESTSKPTYHAAFTALEGSNIRMDMSDSLWVVDGEFVDVQVQCGSIRLPICHDASICSAKSEQSEEETVDVFVKRIAAISAGQKNASSEESTRKKKALWMMQGGPGMSSKNLEQQMMSLFELMHGEVDVYTMDHRGTGRSEKLQCTAAQAETPGSDHGSSISMDELSPCLEDVAFQIGNRSAAFSVTSAAHDLKRVIEDTQSDRDVFVYGVSYGTYLVERLMHLDAKNVKGYILDSVVSEQLDVVQEENSSSQYFSNWDEFSGRVANQYLERCDEDSVCSSKFNGSRLVDVTWRLFNTLDDAAFDAKFSYAGNVNQCSELLSRSYNVPSKLLRNLFAVLLQHQDLRSLIPVIVYRLDRCEDRDYYSMHSVLTTFGFLETFGKNNQQRSTEQTYPLQSRILYDLIVFSELWESPTPDVDALIDKFNASVVGSGAYNMLPAYCIFSACQDEGCAEFRTEFRVENHSTKSFLYARDSYWNQTASIPTGASMLMLSGALDPQTPSEFSKRQFESMKGEAKRLVTFDNAAHATIVTTMTDNWFEGSCAAQIIASFVQQDGDVDAVDESCKERIPGLSFKVMDVVSNVLFHSTDAYDSDAFVTSLASNKHGENEETSSSSDLSPKNERSMLFYVLWCVLAALFVCSVIMMAVVICRSSVKNTESESLEKNAENNDEDTLEEEKDGTEKKKQNQATQEVVAEL